MLKVATNGWSIQKKKNNDNLIERKKKRPAPYQHIVVTEVQNARSSRDYSVLVLLNDSKHTAASATAEGHCAVRRRVYTTLIHLSFIPRGYLICIRILYVLLSTLESWSLINGPLFQGIYSHKSLGQRVNYQVKL